MNSSRVALALALVLESSVAAAQTLPPLPPPGSAAERGSALSAESFPYEGNEPVPPGARVVTRQRVGLIATGASFFGMAWFLSATMGVFLPEYDGGGQGWLVAPVVGPFVFAGVSERPSNGLVALVVIDGLVQAAGLAMFVGALTHPVRSLVYDATPGPRWSLLPSFAGGPGASLRVVF